MIPDFENDENETIPDGLDARRTRVVRTALAELGANSWEKYTDGITAAHPGRRVAWCGIFALWVLHQCALARDWQWVYGKGFLSRLPRTRSPKPGDMVYFDQPFQHHAILVSLNGGMVHTVDGNQAGDCVAERTRPIEEVSAFFSIDPLLRGTNPPRL